MRSARSRLLGDRPDALDPDTIYAGFGRRAYSLVIDVTLVVAANVTAIEYIYAQPKTIAGLYIGALWAATVLYPVFFHAHWGRTIGKMAAGIRVRRLDASRIRYRDAILRSVVDIILVLGSIVSLHLTLDTLTGSTWDSLGTIEKIRLLNERDATNKFFEMAHNTWYWSELLCLLLSEKRRAIHDFIAGTVVVVE